MPNYILDYINIIDAYNVCGVKSVQYILFFVSIFKTNTFNKIINIKDLTSNLVSIKEKSYYNILEEVKKKINIVYYIFDFEFENNNEMLEKLVDFTIKLLESEINIKSLINDCFITHINNENLSVIKEYIKFYNNPNLIRWIFEIANIKQSDKILDANCKINSFYDIINENKNIKDNLKINLYGLQTNTLYQSLILLNNLLNYKKTFEENIGNNDSLINDFTINGSNMYDLIFLDMPHGIHNVIHANCCKKIKKLKLRGTKAEPLLLQLTMSSLNKNGRGVIIVPDSLLFSDSQQPVETREYLINNFNIKKIVQIDESLYWGNEITRDLKSQSSIIKNSIVFFENNGKTTSLEFSKIIQNENQIIETKLCDIKFELFESNGYSLYYKNYLELIKNPNKKISFMFVHELFDIIKSFDELDVKEKILGISKNYKCIDNIGIIDDINNNNIVDRYCLFLKEKQLESIIPNYCIYFLEYKLKLDPEKYTKGKLFQFDIDKIKTIKIPIICKNKQNAVCSYLNITNKIINQNNDKINMCHNMIKCIIETLPTDKMIILDSIVKIFQSSEINSNDISNLIGIVKNGLGAGTIYLPDSHISNNSHYLMIKDENNYLKKYIYEYLKYSQDKIKLNANLTPQPSLTKTFITNFFIPDIDIINQKHICLHCDIFNDVIQKYTCSNTDIKEKNIINTVIQINGF